MDEYDSLFTAISLSWYVISRTARSSTHDSVRGNKPDMIYIMFYRKIHANRHGNSN